MPAFPHDIPTPEEYMHALRSIKMSPKERRLLEAHYLHPDQTMTATELSHAVNPDYSFRYTNRAYGILGHKMSDALGYEPSRRGHNGSPQWTFVLATGRFLDKKTFIWTMRPQFSKALEQLGWFGPRQEPDALADIEAFKERPESQELSPTEREQLTKARIGQGQFRRDLITYWGQCAVTACRELRLLRASHIKPWRHCDNREKLDPYNGLLLAAHLDAAFDAYLITFDANGRIRIAPNLDEASRAALNITPDLQLRQLEPAHTPYLDHHRAQFNAKNKTKDAT